MIVQPPAKTPNWRAQSGMTLIEVLVTLILISVGLLGVAALQLTSLKSNQEAYVRSQASALANYILDRIRSNQRGFNNLEYENVAFNGVGTAGTMSGNDLAQWQLEINRLLPGGNTNAAGAIAVARPAGPTGGAIVTITIRWSERADIATSQAAGTIQFQTRTEI